MLFDSEVELLASGRLELAGTPYLAGSATALPRCIANAVRHAGAVFLGRHTPEVAGDYLAGPNHVLPTGGTARFSSPLSVAAR